MPYRTITTALVDRRGTSVLDAAIERARYWTAHLDACCLAEEDIDPGLGLYGTAVLVRPAETAQDRVDALASATRARLAREDVAWTIRTQVALAEGASRAFTKTARYADLAVLPAPLGPDATTWDSAIFDAALFDAHLPVLVPRGDAAPDYRRVMVAWNGSAVAMAAIRAALLVLSDAEAVTLVVSEPKNGTEGLFERAQEAATFLSRHGIHAEVDTLSGSMPSIARDLVASAKSLGAGLVVMGAYGHSRLRERLIGGVTREMLDRAPVDLLVAH
ncbi:universal stress protein [Roseivivax halodurans JCM 10272]|uniref:Universal stress protein n=1 Tax=Roseivivax halodurans JCM 10272 TaxID=1449350 RepID=X7EN15_9RHOB|nr:universal stress protein [Roseivivax halodurans]ETX16581.1 universal stress protein [Roseivivax halodurans JCM 10272]